MDPKLALTVRFGFELTVACLVCLTSAGAPGQNGRWEIGVAKVDITPDYPIRLTGKEL